MDEQTLSSKPVADPLLETRFFLPQASSAVVLRPRLLERVDEALHVPVTLISAPPGFGKSSLVSQWVCGRENLGAVWLALESSDQEWSLFFRYLAAAWQRVFPGVGQAALAKLNDPPPLKKELLLTILLNDLLAATKTKEAAQALLVLDDYHRIESRDIHELVAYLVEHLPSRCHLVLLTRADPPLPLARWRSHDMLIELRADDLRFTPEEATRYLNDGLHLGMMEAQVHLLQERTEGWIVGLQMAALSIRASEEKGKDVREFLFEFDGTNRFVLDYLLDEVINNQPDDIQQFLMATALFDKFCGSLSDCLLKSTAPSSQNLLERLEKSNLFLIPLDEHRKWFRYHHLFADLLRVRLRQTQPGRIPQLYRQAAEWFSQNGLWQEAIRYALQTKDLDFSADLFEQAITQGGLHFLYSGVGTFIESFPPSWIQAHPLLGLAKAITILESSQLEGIEPLLHSVEQGIRSSPPFPGQEDVLGWLYIIQVDAAIQLGNRERMTAVGRQMPQWIPRDFITRAEILSQIAFSAYYNGDLNKAEAFWQQAFDLSIANHDTDYQLSMLNAIARTANQKGELIRSELLFQQGLKLLEECPDHCDRWLGANQRDYGDLLRECNRLEEARARIEASLPLLEKYHTISALGYGYFSSARVHLSLGEPARAHAMLDRLDDLRQRYTLFSDLEVLGDMTRARIWLEEEQYDQAWQRLDACLASTGCQHTFPREWTLLIMARLLVRTDRPAEALTLLAGWRESAIAGGRGRSWLTICLLEALAHYALGEKQAGFNLLNDGLAFAKMQGQRRVFLDEGEWMRHLLEDFRVQFPDSPYHRHVTEVLSLFPPLRRTSRVSIDLDGYTESLSGREVDILRLVCQGLSNREIAAQLVLSVGTVKFHVHNIFGKLGVHDRPQAIAKAGLIGLQNKGVQVER